MHSTNVGRNKAGDRDCRMRHKICIAEEESGTIRDAFLARGYNAVSCDLKASKSSFGVHHRCDIFDLIDEVWDLFICHPECTYICNSGVRWLYTQPGRWAKMAKGAAFFVSHWGFKWRHFCAENPIPHKYAMKIINRPYSQIIQPYQFGHGETKATCLWLENLPLLQPTNIVAGRYGRIHRLPPGPLRSEMRSTTYKGVADAMAEQWGAFLDKESGFTSANNGSTKAGIAI